MLVKLLIDNINSRLKKYKNKMTVKLKELKTI